jgi:hypothetical protein
LGFKKINITIFGHGLVGERWSIGIGTIRKEKDIKLNVLLSLILKSTTK